MYSFVFPLSLTINKKKTFTFCSLLVHFFFFWGINKIYIIFYIVKYQKQDCLVCVCDKEVEGRIKCNGVVMLFVVQWRKSKEKGKCFVVRKLWCVVDDDDDGEDDQCKKVKKYKCKRIPLRIILFCVLSFLVAFLFYGEERAKKETSLFLPPSFLLSPKKRSYLYLGNC